MEAHSEARSARGPKMDGAMPTLRHAVAHTGQHKEDCVRRLTTSPLYNATGIATLDLDTLLVSVAARAAVQRAVASELGQEQRMAAFRARRRPCSRRPAQRAAAASRTRRSKTWPSFCSGTSPASAKS